MIKILIVDDEATATKYMAKYFSDRLGHQVFAINNPLEAMPIIEKEAPHVVLLDVYMPQMSGLELLKQIKDKYGSTIKVIMVTTATEGDRSQARMLGADEVVHKPFDQEYLRDVVMEKIEDVLGFRRKDKLSPEKIPDILIADDEVKVVKNLEYFIKRVVECRLDIASDGQEAFDLMKKKNYDLVFLDIKMPNKNGIEIMKELKKIKPLPDILVITGYEDASVAEEAKQLGVLDYIVKPIYLESFIRKVKDILEKKGKCILKGS